MPNPSHPRLLLGSVGPWWLRRPFTLTSMQAATHAHLLGVSGSGKSRHLVGLWLELTRLGLPATLLDPHGDAARLAFALAVQRGYLDRPGATERIVYLDFPEAERRGRYLPFNPLARDVPEDAIAADTKEVMHRAWPELAAGAATFDTLLEDVVLLLVHNRLPLTQIRRILIDEAYREALLRDERDVELVASFRDIYEKLRKADQVQYAGSLLRRARQLTQIPVLRHGLGQPTLALDFRRVMDQGTSLLINLSLRNGDAQRLLGCFLTVMAEQSAQSRSALPPGKRGPSHHLIIDEFPEFTTRSDDQFSRMLSQTRKFGLYLWLAQQTLGQLSERMRSAVQNVGLQTVFRVGREDAEYVARLVGRPDLGAVKHVVEDSGAAERTHPVFYSLPEQREALAQELQELRPRQAYVSLFGVQPPRWPWRLFWSRPPRRIEKLHTAAVPDPVANAERLRALEEAYLAQWFTPVEQLERAPAAPAAAARPAAPPRGGKVLLRPDPARSGSTERLSQGTGADTIGSGETTDRGQERDAAGGKGDHRGGNETVLQQVQLRNVGKERPGRAVGEGNAEQTDPVDRRVPATPAQAPRAWPPRRRGGRSRRRGSCDWKAAG